IGKTRLAREFVAWAQYISIKSKKRHLLGCGKRITNLKNHKVFKAFMSLEGLRWWHSPFLGFVLVVDLFDLPSIHAQVPGWQQLVAKAAANALSKALPMLGSKDHGIIKSLADLKDRFRKAEAIRI